MGFLEVASSDLCQDLSLEDADRVSYYLECVVNQFGTEEYPLSKAVVRGKPAESILEYIEEQGVDLVAIATHGYGGLKRWTYGSVTEKILRQLRYDEQATLQNALGTIIDSNHWSNRVYRRAAGTSIAERWVSGPGAGSR